uniref:HTH CENPB-type domain-containing protein n=2 Tax=Amblyomma TaxID=6942 RepID=G3MRL0_AMBMU
MAGEENGDSVMRREQYPAKFKLRVIALAEKVGNRCAGRRYAVSERNVRRWRIDKHRLQHCRSDQRSFRGPKAGRLSFIETELAAFVVASRKKGVKVTWNMIATKARVLATAYGVSQDKFCASRGWMNRFMARQGLSDGCLRSMPLPRYPVFSKHRTEKFSLSQIGIVCQVPIYFDDPADFLDVDDGCCEYDPSRVINVVLACTADGQKMPLYIGFKQDVQDLSLFPSNVHVRHVAHDSDVLHDWVQTVWLSQCGLQSLKKSVLVVDRNNSIADPRVHRVLIDKETQLLEAPGLFDAVCCGFQSALSAIYTDWIVGDGLWRPRWSATWSHIVDWIALAWLSVQRTVVVRAFSGYNEKLGLRLADESTNDRSVNARDIQKASKASSKLD